MNKEMTINELALLYYESLLSDLIQKYRLLSVKERSSKYGQNLFNLMQTSREKIKELQK